MAERDVITGEMWARIEPLLPSSTGKRGGQFRDHRVLVEAICWRLRTGAPWRDLPERFGPWQTAWERFDRWSADGTWARLLEAAQQDADEAGQLGWDVSVDSSVVRAHQHVAGGSGERIASAGGVGLAGGVGGDEIGQVGQHDHTSPRSSHGRRSRTSSTG